ncbi:hypothetical protein ES707_14000 [subsurface metagenome]
MKLNAGDVLLTRKGTFGISTVVGEKTKYLISSEIIRLQLEQETISPSYFSVVNNTQIIQSQYQQNAIGAIMGSLSQEVVKNLLIPFPSFPTQQKIAKEVNSRRVKARALNKEAKEVIIKAKQKVEKIILGEVN